MVGSWRLSVGSCLSPTLDETAEVLEHIPRQSLCEVICPLLRGLDLVDGDFTVHDVEPEEMPLDLKVLGPTGDSLVCREKEGTVVVLEDASSNRAGDCLIHADSINEFDEQRPNR